MSVYEKAAVADMNSADAPLVSVCACTYKRAHIADTLRSVLAQQGVSVPFEIVIVDDDPERSAESMINTLAAETGAPIRYVFSGARNVSAARNAALAAARGEWVAFIDDDELAEPDWLARLLAVQQDSGADIVKGYVRGVYPESAPDWVRRADPFTRDYGADGAPPPRLASGNVLFRRSLVGAHGVRFDPAFGRSGGEDSDFFNRLRQAGARAAASRTAIVNEIVPADRVTEAYLRARNRRQGQTDGRKARAAGHGGGLGASAIAALAVTWAHPLARIVHPALGFKLFSKFWYSRGVIEGVGGRATEEM
ncbi:MAG: glycosyltransferase family 2 protein [Hyphomonadaceae bacterium]